MRPYVAGNHVRTMCDDEKVATVTAARQDTKWGVIGEVTEVLAGGRYRVKHPDGTTAEYAQNELMRVLM